MTARADVVGVVQGEAFVTVWNGRTVASFVLADDQEVVSDAGHIVSAEVGWCQVLCLDGATIDVAASFQPGDEVAVAGVLKLTRPDPGSDAVLVTLVADRAEKGPTRYQ